MGATNSVNDILSDNIYISCLENDQNAELLCMLLRNQGYNVMNQIYEFNTDVDSLTKSVQRVLSKTMCVMVCITEKTVRSFHQIIEMNNILDSTKKVIYLMTEEGFTPDTNVDIQRFIKENLWFPAYDENTIHYTVSQINAILE
jgi:hypothetical protein